LTLGWVAIKWLGAA